MSAKTNTAKDLLLERCLLLKNAGASKNFINEFIVEYVIDLESELNEGFLSGIGDFFKGAAKGFSTGFEGIKSTLVEKLASFILESLGFKEGPLKKLLVVFIGNQSLKDLMILIKGNNQQICANLGADLAQTLVEFMLMEVVAKYIADEAGALHIGAKEGKPGSGLNIASALRNMLMDSDTDTGFTGKLKTMLSKYICSIDYRKVLSNIDLFETLQGKQARVNEKRSYQERMKVRLKRAKRTLLDGGRKDLVKYGKPWNKGRQEYSNALAKNEASAVPNIAGYASPLGAEPPTKKKTKKRRKNEKK